VVFIIDLVYNDIILGHFLYDTIYNRNYINGFIDIYINIRFSTINIFTITEFNYNINT